MTDQQSQHIGFGLNSRGFTKYPVNGLVLAGAGVDGTDIFMLYCTQTHVGVVVRAVRA